MVFPIPVIVYQTARTEAKKDTIKITQYKREQGKTLKFSKNVHYPKSIHNHTEQILCWVVTTILTQIERCHQDAM